MESRKHIFPFLVLLAMVLVACFLWQVSLDGLSKAGRRPIRYLYDQMKIRMQSKAENTTSESSTMVLDVNGSRYSLPHNASVLGRPFIMDKSIANIVRNVLANQTFKRKPVKLDSMETFPEIVAVTAASSNHFEEHKRNIQTFFANFPGVKLIFYDLGLEASEIKQSTEQAGIEYRKFDFSRYPAHVTNTTLRNYSWKLLIIQQLLAEFDGVLWFDASIRFERNLSSIKERMLRYNVGFQFYIHIAGHSIVSAIHPRMFEYFPMDRSARLSPMLPGFAFMAVNTAEVQNNIMKWVCICVLNEDCISPPGSTVSGCRGKFPPERFGGCHRYDQALLSILVSNTYGYERVRYIAGPKESIGYILRPG